MSPFAVAADAFRKLCAAAGQSPPVPDEGRSRVKERPADVLRFSLVRLADARGRQLAMYYVVEDLKRRIPPRAERAYTADELKALAPVLAEVRAVWEERCLEYIRSAQPEGSFVKGAGIAVQYLYPRSHWPRSTVVISPPGPSQQSLTWEDSVEEMLALLRSKGVDAFYACGSLD